MVGRHPLEVLILVRIQVPQQASEGERSAQRHRAAGARVKTKNGPNKIGLFLFYAAALMFYD